MTTSNDLTRPVWYALYQYAVSGLDIAQITRPDAVRISSESQLFEFRKAVREDSCNKLAGIDANELELYANCESFEKEPLNVEGRLESLGMSFSDHIAVLIPREVAQILSPVRRGRKVISDIVGDAGIAPNAHEIALGSGLPKRVRLEEDAAILMVVNATPSSPKVSVRGEYAVQMNIDESHVDGVPVTLNVPFENPNMPRADSERYDELLPRTVAIDGPRLKLPFVNREIAVLRLLAIHWSHFVRRYKSATSEGTDIYMPLMDNMRGAGKSRFGACYVACASRLSITSPTITVDGQLLSLPYETETGHSEVHKEFLAELKQTRTLVIDFSKSPAGCLCLSTNQPDALLKALRMAVKNQWNMDLKSTEFLEGVDEIADKFPIFIFFDEIGHAFDRSEWTSEQKRESFLFFCSGYGIPLIRRERVYIHLSGKEDFLLLVGLRSPYQTGEQGMSGSTCRFLRIALNPIRHKYVEELVSRCLVLDPKTGSRQTIKDMIGEGTCAEFSRSIHRLTSGHSRNITRLFEEIMSRWRISRSIAIPADYESKGVDDYDVVKLIVSMFPEQCMKLYRVHMACSGSDDPEPGAECPADQIINLNEKIFMGGAEAQKFTTFEFLATRLYCSFGLDTSRTRLSIPSLVLPILFTALDPFRFFLSKLEPVFDSRKFEILIVKWWQSIFSQDSKGSCGELLGEFLPRESKLWNVEFHFPRFPTIGKFPAVMGTGKMNSEDPSKNISISRASKLLQEEVARRESCAALLPEPLSHSPDAFILPRGEFDGKHVVIGLAVKGNRSNVSDAADLLDEAFKFAEILSGMKRTKGYLFFISTRVRDKLRCQGGSTCLPRFEEPKQEARNAVAKLAQVKRVNALIDEDRLEVIIMNLHSVEARVRFCDAISAGLDVKFEAFLQGKEKRNP